MESMRVTGIMSGLDVNGIVDSYMEAAKAPINRIDQKVSGLTFEKTTYNDFISKISDLKDLLLPLKMEATFKSKVTDSSNSNVATATAQVGTPVGSYNIKVDSVAEPAYASSIYVQPTLSKKGAGVGEITSLTGPYDQLEGTHSVSIKNDTDKNLWIAKDTFKSNYNTTYGLTRGSATSVFSSNGVLEEDLTETVAIYYTYNGVSSKIDMTFDYKVGTGINSIASDIELNLNAKLDALNGNSGKANMKVTVNRDEKTGAFSFNFYDINDEADIEIIGFLDPNNPKDDTSAAYKMSQKLGMTATYPTEQAKAIENYMVGKDAKDLQDKLNGVNTPAPKPDPNVSYGTITPSADGKVWSVEKTTKPDDTTNLKISSYGPISSVSTEGIMTENLNGAVDVFLGFNGIPTQFTLDIDIKNGEDIKNVVSNLEEKINKKIKEAEPTASDKSIKVVLAFDSATNKYSFDFYSTDTQNELDFWGFFDQALGDITTKLGIDNPQKTAEATTEIKESVVATNKEDLEQIINPTPAYNKKGAFLPVSFTFAEGGLKEGTFEIYQDATANSRPATYSTITGAELKKAAAETKENVDKWLTSKISDTGTNYFDTNINLELKGLNGYFELNGVKIEIEDYTKYSPNEIMAKVNSSGAGVTMTWDYEENSFVITNNETGSGEITMGGDTDTSNFFYLFKTAIPTGGTYVRGQNKGSLDVTAKLSSAGYSYEMRGGTFTINGVSIFVDTANDSTQDIIDKVNKSGAGVTLNYDTYSDKFSLTSKTGEVIKVGGESDTSTFLLAAGLLYSQTTEQQIGSESKDAVFSVNGIKYARDTNVVSDIVPGMEIRITGPGQTIINVEIDTDKTVKALAEFAAAYNELINKLNPTEVAYNDQDRKKYSTPLTEDDKAKMSEDEVKEYQKKYERIAYYDIVARSSEMRQVKTTIRGKLTLQIISDTQKTFKNLTEIGVTIAGSDIRDISVTKFGFLFDTETDAEKLADYIKENSKFVDKLKENSDDMYKFFAEVKSVKAEDGTSSIQNVGWARVYGDFLDSLVNSSSALYKKTSTSGAIESQISSLNTQRTAQQRRMEMYLERLYSQFAAMEDAVGKMQSNAQYLSNLSSGGGGGGTTAG